MAATREFKITNKRQGRIFYDVVEKENENEKILAEILVTAHTVHFVHNPENITLTPYEKSKLQLEVKKTLNWF